MRRCWTAWQSASPTGPECCTAAGEAAEHPFGSIKHWMGHGGFLMRRLENVRGEFSLTALAYNIRRATTLVGIPEIAAWGVQTSWNHPPKGPVATHQGAWHQRIDDNPLTAQIPGLSHRKIRLGPTFHTVSSGYATLPRPTCFQRLRRFETVLQYRFDWRYLCAMMIGSSSPG